MKIHYTTDRGEKMTTEAKLIKESVAIDAEGRIWQEYWSDEWKTRGYGRPRDRWGMDGGRATSIDND